MSEPMSEPQADNTIVLLMPDSTEIPISESLARHMNTVANALEDHDDGDHVVPISNVSSETMRLVVQYLERCEKLESGEGGNDDCNNDSDCDSDSEFECCVTEEERATKERNAGLKKRSKVDNALLSPLPQEQMKDLMLAANFLNYKPLLDSMANSIYEKCIKSRNVQSMREALGVEKDFTEEEWKKVKADVAWSGISVE